MVDSETGGMTRVDLCSPRAVRAESLRSVLVDAAGYVRRYMFGLCGRWDEAEDLTQEALLKAWAKRESFDGRADARTWVFAIARNHWFERLRRRRARPREQAIPDESVIIASSPGPPQQLARKELLSIVEAALGKLPPEQREALALWESEGMSFSQIAELVQISPATVKSRVRYALKKLARELKPFHKELEA